LLLCIAQPSTAAEYRSKANFLATFPSFVDWPESAFSSTQAPLLICVRGDFSFGTSLAELARGALSHGRRIEVRWVHKDQELRTCHIAFVSRSESKRYAKLLQALDGAGVLTVGETDDFLAAGGAITFSFERETLQFEVNLVAAENARLKISSRLLALARRVRNKSEAAKG
jgi:YfiR/HmsC-like